MSRKIIFLDIDGVLNSLRSCLALGGYPFPGRSKERDWHLFDDVAVGLLRRVVSKTGAVCVLSSSWRLGMDADDLQDLAERLGVPIIGKTRDTYSRERRGEQIRDWLQTNPDVVCYAILDDDSDMMHEQLPYFVKVNHDDGLTYAQHKQLIDLLGGETQ